MQRGGTDAMSFVKGHEPDSTPLFHMDDNIQIRVRAVGLMMFSIRKPLFLKREVWLISFYFYLPCVPRGRQAYG